MFSAYHLNKETVKLYYDVFEKKIMLSGYTDIHHKFLFASLLKEKNLFDLQLSFVGLGSENLLEHQIKIIEEEYLKE